MEYTQAETSEVDEIHSLMAEAQFNKDVITVGGRTHSAGQEGWRQDHTLPDGQVEPRPKQTTDRTWIEAHGGVDIVDIAITDFADLPSDRQAESVASATMTVEDVYRDAFFGQSIKIYEDEGEAAVRAYLSSDRIHDGWLSRNRDSATEEQKLKFVELSQAEKDKDIDFHDGAVDAVVDRLKNGTFKVPDRLLLQWSNEYAQALTAKPDLEAEISDLRLSREGWVSLKLSIGAHGESLDGEYPLETIATYLHDKLYVTEDEPIAQGADNLLSRRMHMLLAKKL